MNEQEMMPDLLEAAAKRHPDLSWDGLLLRRAARTIRRLEGEVADLRGERAPSGRRYRMKDGVLEWSVMRRPTWITGPDVPVSDLDVVECVRKGVGCGE